MSGLTVTLQGTCKDAASYRALGKRMTATVQDEPGTIRYEWMLDDTGTKFRNVDGYDNSESFLAHMGAASESGMLDEYMGLVEVERVEVHGEVSDAARGALDGFGAIYLDTFEGFVR